jgi:hypothetical protein
MEKNNKTQYVPYSIVVVPYYSRHLRRGEWKSTLQPDPEKRKP